MWFQQGGWGWGFAESSGNESSDEGRELVGELNYHRGLQTRKFSGNQKINSSKHPAKQSTVEAFELYEHLCAILH